MRLFRTVLEIELKLNIKLILRGAVSVLLRWNWTSNSRYADSCVARVPCARKQEIFLRRRQQKPQSLKWKIGAKVRKKQK